MLVPGNDVVTLTCLVRLFRTYLNVIELQKRPPKSEYPGDVRENEINENEKFIMNPHRINFYEKFSILHGSIPSFLFVSRSPDWEHTWKLHSTIFLTPQLTPQSRWIRKFFWHSVWKSIWICVNIYSLWILYINYRRIIGYYIHVIIIRVKCPLLFLHISVIYSKNSPMLIIHRLGSTFGSDLGWHRKNL